MKKHNDVPPHHNARRTYTSNNNERQSTATATATATATTTRGNTVSNHNQQHLPPPSYPHHNQGELNEYYPNNVVNTSAATSTSAASPARSRTDDSILDSLLKDTSVDSFLLKDTSTIDDLDSLLKDTSTIDDLSSIEGDEVPQLQSIVNIRPDNLVIGHTFSTITEAPPLLSPSEELDLLAMKNKPNSPDQGDSGLEPLAAPQLTLSIRSGPDEDVPQISTVPAERRVSDQDVDDGEDGAELELKKPSIVGRDTSGPMFMDDSPKLSSASNYKRNSVGRTKTNSPPKNTLFSSNPGTGSTRASDYGSVPGSAGRTVRQMSPITRPDLLSVVAKDGSTTAVSPPPVTDDEEKFTATTTADDNYNRSSFTSMALASGDGAVMSPQRDSVSTHQQHRTMAPATVPLSRKTLPELTKEPSLDVDSEHEKSFSFLKTENTADTPSTETTSKPVAHSTTTTTTSPQKHRNMSPATKPGAVSVPAREPSLNSGGNNIDDDGPSTLDDEVDAEDGRKPAQRNNDTAAADRASKNRARYGGGSSAVRPGAVSVKPSRAPSSGKAKDDAGPSFIEDERSTITSSSSNAADRASKDRARYTGTVRPGAVAVKPSGSSSPARRKGGGDEDGVDDGPSIVEEDATSRTNTMSSTDRASKNRARYRGTVRPGAVAVKPGAVPVSPPRQQIANKVDSTGGPSFIEEQEDTTSRTSGLSSADRASKNRARNPSSASSGTVRPGAVAVSPMKKASKVKDGPSLVEDDDDEQDRRNAALQRKMRQADGDKSNDDDDDDVGGEGPSLIDDDTPAFRRGPSQAEKDAAAKRKAGGKGTPAQTPGAVAMHSGDDGPTMLDDNYHDDDDDDDDDVNTKDSKNYKRSSVPGAVASTSRKSAKSSYDGGESKHEIQDDTATTATGTTTVGTTDRKRRRRGRAQAPGAVMEHGGESDPADSKFTNLNDNRHVRTSAHSQAISTATTTGATVSSGRDSAYSSIPHSDEAEFRQSQTEQSSSALSSSSSAPIPPSRTSASTGANFSAVPETTEDVESAPSVDAAVEMGHTPTSSNVAAVSSSSTRPGVPHALSAVLVTDEGNAEEERERIRQQAEKDAEANLLATAVDAVAVKPVEDETKINKKLYIGVGCLIVVAVVAVVLAVVLTEPPTKPGTIITNFFCEDAIGIENMTSLVEQTSLMHVAGGFFGLAEGSIPDLIGDADGDRCQVTTDDAGNGTWYFIDGTGSLMRASTCDGSEADLQLLVFSGTCDDLQCTGGSDNICGDDLDQGAVGWFADVGVRYYILVRGQRSQDTGDFNLTIDNFEDNGACARAVRVEVGDGQSVFGSTRNFALEDTIEDCGGATSTNAGAWYQVEGTGEAVCAAAIGEGFNDFFRVEVSVFEGACTDLTCVDGAPDANINLDSGSFDVGWLAEQGVTYSIFVRGERSGGGDFFLNLRHPVQNAICETATTVQINENISVSGTLAGSCNENVMGDCPNVEGNRGVWYEVMGTGELLLATVTGLDCARTNVVVFSGDDCSSLECFDFTPLDCTSTSQATTRWVSTANRSSYLFVQSSDSRFEDFDLSVGVLVPEVADTCQDAFSVQIGDDDPAIGFTITASPSDIPVIAACAQSTASTASASNSSGVFYMVNGTGDDLVASTCGAETTFDTKISILAGSTCGDGLTCLNTTELPCDDGQGTIVLWNSVEGETYVIHIHGSDASDVGYFTLSVNVGSANDFCFTAEELTIPSNVFGSTINANFDDVTFCQGNGENLAATTAPSVWYTVVGQGEGLVASTCNDGTDFDTQIYVYSGSCGSTSSSDGTDTSTQLECITANDDGQECNVASEVFWLAEQDVRYYILITGFGDDAGNFDLQLSGLF